MLRTALLFALLVVGCSGGEPLASAPPEATPAKSTDATTPTAPPPPSPSAPAPSAPPPKGSDAGAPPAEPPFELKVLTYNVAGLPQGLSQSNPIVNMPLISPKLNAFDLVFVQEDFSYHPQLVSQVTALPYQSTPSTAGTLGDGLNLLSRYPLGAVTRTAWSSCNGTIDEENDCLTPKGFARAVQTLPIGGGVDVDVYDAHFDAGRSAGDIAARNAQISQLVAYLAATSPNRAVIVGSDTNMGIHDEDQVQRLLTEAGFTDACRALTCPGTARLDRVLYRSSSTVEITATSYDVLTTWDDANGKPLSDHEAVSVRLQVKKH